MIVLPLSSIPQQQPTALLARRAAELEEQIAALQLRQAACTPRPAKDLGIMADMLSPQVGSSWRLLVPMQ